LVGGKVFITGGASGIGFAIARKFVLAGATVAIADLDETTGIAAQRELESVSSTVRFLPVDLSSPNSVVAPVAAAIEELGALDYAINNAGIAFSGSTMADTEFEQWRRVMAVNLDGVILCMREELKVMQARGSPRSSCCAFTASCRRTFFAIDIVPFFI